MPPAPCARALWSVGLISTQASRDADLRKWGEESDRLGDKSANLAAQLAALAAEKEALAAAAAIGATGDPNALRKQEEGFQYVVNPVTYRTLSNSPRSQRQAELEAQLADTNDALRFLENAAKAEEDRWAEKNKEYEGAVAAVAYLQQKCQELSEQVCLLVLEQ